MFTTGLSEKAVEIKVETIALRVVIVTNKKTM
jgi:hypothetical protein